MNALGLALVVVLGALSLAVLGLVIEACWKARR